MDAPVQQVLEPAVLLRWFSRAFPASLSAAAEGLRSWLAEPFPPGHGSHEAAQMVLTTAPELWELPSYFGAGNGREEAAAPRGGSDAL